MQILPKNHRIGVFILSILLLPIFLGGCTTSTPYQRIGNKKDGGYSTTRHSNDSYSVTFQGRENSNPEQVYDYALLRSAEMTVECGYAYFLVTSDNDRSRELHRYNPGTPGYTTTHYRSSAVTGNTYAYSSYNPGMPGNSYQVKVPIFTLMIKMYKAKDGIQAPTSQIFEAAPLIIQLKTKYQLK